MSIVSTAIDAATSALSSWKTYLYCAAGGVILAAAGGVYLYVHSLHSTIETQKTTLAAKDQTIKEKDTTITNKTRDIQIVKDDRTEALAELENTQSKLSTLNSENEKNAQNLAQYKAKNDILLRNHIHAIQALDACSNTGIPTDTLRLWSNSINEFNGQYVSGTSGSHAEPAKSTTSTDVQAASVGAKS
jgi:hypothetical protein